MKDSLSAELQRIVGFQNISTDRGQLDRFAGDALGVFRAYRAASRLNAQPGAIVWPTTTAQVSEVLRFANQHGIPVVPYGGGTGVMGAATSSSGCIVLNLQRMNAVLSVSREDMTARLQAGVVLQNAATSMEEAGLVLGHDPWSRPVATVGGAISTNGVGYTAARHGSMGEQVLGLEAVLADGEVIRTRGVPKPSYGPSLNHLLIGSEGTFGVITEATLRAFPYPDKRVLSAFVFPDFESGFKAVARLYAEGVRPSMVDYGTETWPGEEPSASVEATLYLAFEGFAEDVDAHGKKARQICSELGGSPGDQEEVRRFWNTRHASGERYLREVIQSPNPGKARRERSAYRMEYLHVALPVSQVLEYRRRCQRILASHRVVVREWSLWARPELFSFLIVEEDGGNGTPESSGEVVDKVLTLAQDMGGTMEYCHGVGIKLAHLMDRETGTGMAVMRKMKQALDPNNILNPGKQISQD